MDVRYNNNALAESYDCNGGLLHLGPNVITFRTLLHLGPNVITFRTLLHFGPNVIAFRTLLHLGPNVITFRTLLHFGLYYISDFITFRTVITFRPSTPTTETDANFKPRRDPVTQKRWHLCYSRAIIAIIEPIS